MTLKTTPYLNYETHLPQSGNHILAQQRNENLIVYQAFNPNIARYAVENQRFGGDHYSFGRMSWIKPNFLWMMYRSGWAGKPGQERILAIEISKANFETILAQAVYANFQEHIYETKDNWKAALANSEVRLQWDPDHSPYGEKLQRRAIQLGLKGKILHTFATDWIARIEDITGFVQEQAKNVAEKDLNKLQVMTEMPLMIKNPSLNHFLKIEPYPVL